MASIATAQIEDQVLGRGLEGEVVELLITLGDMFVLGFVPEEFVVEGALGDEVLHGVPCGGLLEVGPRFLRLGQS